MIVAVDNKLLATFMKSMMHLADSIQDNAEGAEQRRRPNPEYMAAAVGIGFEALTLGKLYTRPELVAVLKDCLLNIEQESVEGPKRKPEKNHPSP